ncbi:hypothetical protein GCM10010193_37210 [Kitasatospora atroaurantiaca]|uniref:Secreted protein n=1 Tax=Kitasatospora atroaurantiaca TaxID=285545 RepID=A0A561ESZ1_9ACTN|nr:hypothetical protein [Kitasatospora atroaurantiaca]TWE18737.1 hypothetical protein FB465_3825 [Kitasatospora atroaurantiaca]
MHSSTRRTLTAVAAAAALTLTLAACGSSTDHSSMPGMSHGSAASSPSTGTSAGAGGHDMAAMKAATDGLAAELGGYRLDAAATTLPAGAAAEYRFSVTGPDGRPVTAFAVDQTKQMHFYAVRSDLTGFQHLHPTMAADGTWTAPLDALQPGSWRLYASFTPDSGPGRGTGLVLSRTVTVPGAATDAPLPAAAGSTTADGYTVTVEGSPVAGKAGELKVGIAKDGKPVTDLQPYLETYAHLTAFHAGDLSFAHLHPETAATGDGGGPTLPFHAELPKSGDWRLFLQFRTGGTLHTAALTLRVS